MNNAFDDLAPTPTTTAQQGVMLIAGTVLVAALFAIASGHDHEDELLREQRAASAACSRFGTGRASRVAEQPPVYICELPRWPK